MQKPDFDVAIIGAGFSGLGMAIKLKELGTKSFVVLEKGAHVGGTWAENRYPGCACDIPSNLYSYSFAPNPYWSRAYPAQPEIWDYLEKCADRFGVREHIRFGTALKSARWDDAAKLWRVESAGGASLTARAVVSGMGGLHVPNEPALEGLAGFGGRYWHSARWPEDVSLDGKRVAVIGTGASAIQIVPTIAPSVAQVDLYQRTPPWIVPRLDHAVSETAKDFYVHAPVLQEMRRKFIYLRNETRALLMLRPGQEGGLAERQALKHLENQVADLELRAKLTPNYRLGCKRVLISDDYYPALQRENVSLITHPATRVTANGIVDSEGVERAADVIVFATGFKPFEILSGVAINGVGGRSLNEEWKRGPEAYLGVTVSGYPNLFMLMGPNTGLGHNSMIYMIESQIAFVLDALKEMDRRGVAALDVRADAQRAFNDEIREKLKQTVWGSGCRSWYLAEDGSNHTLWPGYTFDYRKRTKRVKTGDFEFV